MSTNVPHTIMKKKGFTIIELLASIAIISVLSAIVVPNILNYRERARDDIRRADLKSLQLALEKYYSIYKQYPSTCNVCGLLPITLCTTNNPGTALCTSGGFNITNVRWFYATPLLTQHSNSGNWIPALVNTGLVTSLPTDPREGSAPVVTDLTCRSTTKVTYRYRSTGAHYKLQAFCGVEGADVTVGDEMYNSSFGVAQQATLRSLVVTDIPLPAGQSCAGVVGAEWFDVPACW